MSESKVMRAQGDFRCANCFHFRMAETCSQVTPTVPYCDRRERQIGWNPVLFMCGDYASKDGQTTMQTSLDWRWPKGAMQ